MSATTRRLIPLRRRIVYTLAVFIAFLISAELTLRIINPQYIQLARTFHRIHGPSDVALLDFKPTCEGTFKLDDENGREIYNFTVRTNERRIRIAGGATQPSSKTAETDRTIIHCIGDSFTMGWGVESQEAYPAILQELCGPSMLVLNLGVDGFGLISASRKSDDVGRVLPPDVVVYLFCPNDFADDQITVRDGNRSELSAIADSTTGWFQQTFDLGELPFLLVVSRLQSESRDLLDRDRKIEGPIAKDSPVVDSATMLLSAQQVDLVSNATTRELEQLHRNAKSKGTKLVVVVMDSDRQALEMIRFAQSAGIDLCICVANASWRIEGDRHLNARGCRLLARHVHAHLRATNSRSGTESISSKQDRQSNDPTSHGDE